MLARFVIGLVLVLVAYVASAFVNPIPKRDIDLNFKPKYGVSYSFEQAAWYGFNPRQSYINLLDQFNFAWVRLPFFWNLTLLRSKGATEGQVIDLNLDDLEFAIDQAQKRNIGVIIALGAKTPYFPEYHWPEEIAAQVEFGQKITIEHPMATRILNIDKKVVQAVAIYPNIIYWQVENEPLVGNVNKWKIDPSLVAAEIKIINENDPFKRPIILNHAASGFYDQSWKSLLSILRPGDVFAMNAFFKTKGTDLITASIFGRNVHILWPDHLVWPVHSWRGLSPNFENIKKQVEAKGIKFWILEMQAEPYIKKIEEADDPFLTFEPGDILEANRFLLSYKIESIGLWGAHFWQFRDQNGDSRWIDAVGELVNY